MEDYLLCKKHSIEPNNMGIIKIEFIVNNDGSYSIQAPNILKGLKVQNKETIDLIIKLLNNDCLFSDEIEHSVPLDWRTKKPVIQKL